MIYLSLAGLEWQRSLASTLISCTESEDFSR